MRKRICPICECEQYNKIEKIKLLIPVEFRLPNEYDIVSCDTCGFCFADTEATLEDYNSYYSNCNSYSGTPVGSEEWNWLNEPVNKLMQPYIRKDYRLLDMGFGKGNFLRYLKQHGYDNIIGVDPSKESVEAVRKDGIRAVIGSIFEDAAKEYQHSADCVFLFDVLEHLLYPLDAIKTLRSYLKTNGYLVLSVPNYAYLKENQNPIVNMFNQEHINYFSKISLDNLLRQCGFTFIDSNRTEQEEEIIAIYQMTEETVYSELTKDDICKDSIVEYVERFAKRKALIEKKLAEICKKNIGNIYVWGTGAFTMWLLANTSLVNFHIRFVDNNITKIGKKIGDGEIISPSSIKEEQFPIVICSMLYGENIHKQIKEMKLKNTVIIL